MLDQLTKRLKQQGAVLNVDNAVRFFLAEEGYDPIYGARPLRRAITKFLEDKLAEACLSNIIHEGTQINITQEIKPNASTGLRAENTTFFDDIYTAEILVDFDHSKVDFSRIETDEKEEKTVEETNSKPKVEA